MTLPMGIKDTIELLEGHKEHLQITLEIFKMEPETAQTQMMIVKSRKIAAITKIIKEINKEIEDLKEMTF